MEKKLTKKDYFAMLKEIVIDAGNIVMEDELVAFIDHEVELLNKKSASKSKKDLANATENDRLGAIALDLITNSANGLTITEMMKSNDELGALSNQKVSAVVRKLVDNGTVERAAEKGKAIFRLR